MGSVRAWAQGTGLEVWDSRFHGSLHKSYCRLLALSRSVSFESTQLICQASSHTPVTPKLRVNPKS